MVKKKTLINRIEDVLYSGANFTQPEGAIDNETSTYSSNYSPNNLKSIILSQEGAILTFYTTASNQHKLVRRVNFPQNQDTFTELQEGKEVLSFLAGRRVYTSLSEIVVISSTGEQPAFELPGRQLHFVVSNILKRIFHLKDVVIMQGIKSSLEELQDMYELQLNKKLMSDIPEIAEDSSVKIIPAYEDWYKNKYLRPSYYKIDEAESDLDHKLKQIEIKNKPEESGMSLAEDDTEDEENEEGVSTDEQVEGQPISHSKIEELNNLVMTYQAVQESTQIEYSSHINITQVYLQGVFKPVNLELNNYVRVDEEIKDSLEPQEKKLFEILEEMASGNAQSVEISNLDVIIDEFRNYFKNRINHIYNRQDFKLDQENKSFQILNVALNQGFIKMLKEPQGKGMQDILLDQLNTLGQRELGIIANYLVFPKQQYLELVKANKYNQTKYKNNEESLEENKAYALVQDVAYLESGFEDKEETESHQVIIHDAKQAVIAMGKQTIQGGFYLKSFNDILNQGKELADIKTLHDTNTEVTLERIKQEEPEVLPLDVDAEDFPELETQDKYEIRVNNEEEQDTKEVEEKVAGSQNQEVKRYVAWLDRVEQVVSEEHVNIAVQGVSAEIKGMVSTLKEVVQESEIEDFSDKEIRNDLIELQMDELNQITDSKFDIYLSMKQQYFDTLKSVQVLNSGNNSLTNNFGYYYTVHSTGVSASEMYKYPQSLYYILKGSVRS